MYAEDYTPDIHWGHTMRPRKARRVNRFLLLMAAAGAVLAAGTMATARADDIATLSGAMGPYLAKQQHQCFATWSPTGAMGGRLA